MQASCRRFRSNATQGSHAGRRLEGGKGCDGMIQHSRFGASGHSSGPGKAEPSCRWQKQEERSVLLRVRPTSKMSS